MTAMPATVPELLARAARTAVPRRGVFAADANVPWPALLDAAHGLARSLHAHGVQAGDRVAIYIEPSAAYATALFGAACAGCIAVPIHDKLRDAQVSHVLRDAGAKVVVTSAAKLTYLADSAQVLAGCMVVLADAPAPSGTHNLAAWCARREGTLPTVAAGDLAVILYTSGSTGLPKGIVQDHGNLAHGAQIVCGYLGLRATDRIFGALPLSFDYGLNQLLDAAWLASDYLAQGYFTVADLVAGVERARATVLAGVPSLWAALGDALRAEKVAPARLARLRVLTNSGGRFYERDIDTLRQHLPRAAVFSMYGLTEAFRSSYLPPAELARRPTSIGKAIPGVDLLVIDPVTQRPCAPGEVGELVHAGALVARGYWNNLQATAARFRPHPLDSARGLAVFSGDLVRTDAEGFLYFVARKDAQLKVSGHRVAPDEIEQVIHRVPGVQLAVVLGVEDHARADTRLVACMTVGGDPDAVVGAVRAASRRELPAYMVPSEFRVLSEMPLNSNGKPDRAAVARSLRDE
jgi:acyl-CoA synthetase (AMP-forming)/AMP-acid ligase II